MVERQGWQTLDGPPGDLLCCATGAQLISWNLERKQRNIRDRHGPAARITVGAVEGIQLFQMGWWNVEPGAFPQCTACGYIEALRWTEPHTR